MKKSLPSVNRILTLALRPFIREVAGLESFPRQGGALLVSNHLSVLDGLVLAVALTERVRPVHFISYRYLFDIPVVGFILRTYEGIVLDSSSREGIDQAMAECRRYLAAGEVVALFPEAHTSPFGKMHRGRPGAARLALDCAVPVVPVGIVGAEKVMPRADQLPGVRWKAVSVRFGEALSLSAYRPAYLAAGEAERLAILEGATTIIMRTVAALSGQKYPYGGEAASQLEQYAASGAR